MSKYIYCGLIVVTSFSFLIVPTFSSQDLLKVYPLQNVCDSENSEEKILTKFTEDEIWEKCQGFKFAQITETCGSNRRGKISCCNGISENSTETNFVQISKRPNLVNLCPDSLWDSTFGAFEDRGNLNELSTLYINDNYSSNGLYQTHDYFGCIHKDVALKYESTGNKV